MLIERLVAGSIREYLDGKAGDAPVRFFCPAVLGERHALFRRHFPGLVTFAVKSNPGEDVLAQLAAEGMAGFDVASPDEIALVRRIAPEAALHYHNPVRSRAEIAAAVAAGVGSYSVDRMGELEKLLAAGLPRTAEVAVRIALPVAGAAYDFGSKFGAAPDLAEALMRRAAAAGMRVSLTFHVGTQCTDPSAWAAYLAEAKRLCEATGIRLASLNVGGGFPSGRDGRMPDLMPIFAAIAAFVPDFPGTRFVCEPGRGLVGDAYAYAVRIKAIAGRDVFLTDGIYGGLSEMPHMGVNACEAVLQGGGEPAAARGAFTLWGPTCDSLDRLPGEVFLPADIGEGDWIVFRSMGAYLYGVNTRFNGYGAWEDMRVATLA